MTVTTTVDMTTRETAMSRLFNRKIADAIADRLFIFGQAMMTAAMGAALLHG